MKKLIEGIKKFQKEDFVSQKDLFQSLGNKQEPHTLFIGCSDSRVVPNLITKTFPGELFTIRNVANIVPRFEEAQNWASTAAAIEYAVQVLKVKNIVICGHSNCGGCNALNKSAEDLKSLPLVSKWLQISKDVKGEVDKLVKDNSPEERVWLTEQVNIRVQMNHLLTYPYIKEAVDNKEIKIFGWHYIIESGDVYNFNDEKIEFEKIS